MRNRFSDSTALFAIAAFGSRRPRSSPGTSERNFAKLRRVAIVGDDDKLWKPQPSFFTP